MTSHMLKNSCIAIGCVLACAASAVAQTPSNATAPSQDEPVVLSQVLVTGSYLPDSPSTATKPVLVVGSDQIADSGVSTDLADILRKTVPQFTGNGNLGLENAGSEAFVTQGGDPCADKRQARRL